MTMDSNYDGNSAAIMKMIRALFRKQTKGGAVLVLESVNALLESSNYELTAYDNVVIADCYRQLGDYSTALKHFRFALQTCPASRRESVYARIGGMFLNLGRLDSAARWFRRSVSVSLEDNQWSMFAQMNLAKIFVMKCDLTSAETLIAAALESSFATAEAWMLAATILIARRKLQRAKECIDEAIEKFPEADFLHQLSESMQTSMELRKSIQSGESAENAITQALLK